MTRGLLISGMFRSGTTLLSRMISAHPRALAVSDPFVYFYKVLRSHIAAQEGLMIDASAPSSTWFDDEQARAMRSLLTSDLNLPISDSELERLRALVREWKSKQHPELAARMEEVKGRTFAEVMQQFLDLCNSVYGKGRQLDLLGTKLSWSEEFIGATARSFPDMKFIIPVRDPRAIVASQNSQTGPECGKRPLLFYIRHWRKSVAFAWFWTQLQPDLKDRVRIVRYEDLVQDPAATLPPIASFLGLDFRPEMLDARGFRPDAGGTPWTPNSSYLRAEQTPPAIYTSSLDQWRQVLTSDEVAFIETLCAPEMRLMGYAATQSPVSIERLMKGTPEPAFAEIAGWLRPFPEAAYVSDASLMQQECTLEAKRIAVLRGADREALNQRCVYNLFILPELLDVLALRANGSHLFAHN